MKKKNELLIPIRIMFIFVTNPKNGGRPAIEKKYKAIRYFFVDLDKNVREDRDLREEGLSDKIKEDKAKREIL